MIVLCPSYLRPQQAGQVYQSFRDTVRLDTELLFVIGIKDSEAYDGHGLPIMCYPEWPMVRRTNRAAEVMAPRYDYIGWIADDNRFETNGWDASVVKALEERPGVVYGNDIVSPGSKPSHVFMDARIVKALGWFLHPGLRSTFFDDVWEQIGRGLTLKYLPDVTVRHLYVEKDNSADFASDMAVYQQWLRHDLDTDLARIRRALRPRRGAGRGSTLAPSGA